MGIWHSDLAGALLWDCCFAAVFWSIWREDNLRCFFNESASPLAVELNLQWSQAIYCVLALDEFDDRQAFDLWWC